MERRTYVVADDQLPLRSLLERALAGPGVKVISAKDGAEALAACRRFAPDLVILDVRMPGIDGLWACEALRRTEATRRLPILLISAGGGGEKGFENADDWLAKPFELTELQKRVESLVALGRRRRAAAA